MRIISGTYKGRRFDLPRSLKARPTTDFAKEALFNILDNRLNYEELDVLDLFSGTGSIGLEFVSRGAASVYCIEQYSPHTKFIRSVVEKLGVQNLRLIQGDVYQYIHKHPGLFDVIFADAPYTDPRLIELPNLIFEAGLLKPEGLLIVEHSKAQHFDEHPHWEETRVYGSVHFSFFSQKIS